MKRTKKVFIQQGLVLLLLAVFSIVFLLGCKPRIDTAKGSVKPDIHTAMLAYEQSTQKKSHFEAGITFTMFQALEKGSKQVTPISFGQMLAADRIQNGNKIYMDATLGATNVSDNFITQMNGIIALMKLVTKNNDMTVDESVMDYITGKTIFAGRVGYDGIDTYNGKGDYINKEEQPNFLDDDGKPLWFATNEQSIQNIQKNFAIQGDISPKDYLMFSTMLDLNPSNGWAKSDIADKYFDTDEDAYLYNITTYGAKLKGLILGFMGDQDIFDEEEYAEELLLYASIYPKVASWISTPDSTVEAKVDRNNKLLSLSSSMRIDININVLEMWEIAALLIPETSEMKLALGLAKVLLSSYFSSSSGETGTWTIRIDFTTNETFSYDDASTNLTNKDQDMFLSSTEENRDRTVINIALDEPKPTK